MFCSDDQIMQDLAGVLKKPDATSLIAAGAFWPSLVSFHHATVYDDIVLALTRRGYTMAQILAWDQGPTRERIITLYRCLESNKALSTASADLIKRAQEYEADLRRTDLVVGGSLSEPGGTGGQVASGGQEAFQNLGRYYPERIVRCDDRGQWGG